MIAKINQNEKCEINFKIKKELLLRVDIYFVTNISFNACNKNDFSGHLLIFFLSFLGN